MTEIRNLKWNPSGEAVTLTLYGGTVYGLTGPGSNLFAEQLNGTVPIDPGCIRVGGAELSSARKRIGFAFNPPLFCEELSPYEFLCMSAKLRCSDSGLLRKIPHLLEEGNLTDVRDRAIRRLNLWQRKTLSVLAAAVGNTELLVIENLFEDADEPTRKMLFEVLDAVRGESTVLLTGREKDLSPFCDKILRFRDGRLQSDDRKTPETGTGLVWQLLVRGEREAILRALEKVEGIRSCRFGMRSDTGERRLNLITEPNLPLDVELRDALAKENCELRELKREGVEEA